VGAKTKEAATLRNASAARSEALRRLDAEDIHALPQVLLNSYFRLSPSVVVFNIEAGTPWQLSQHHRKR